MLSYTATKAQSGNPIQMVQVQWQRYHPQLRQLYHRLVLYAEHSQGPKATQPKRYSHRILKCLGSWGYDR